MPAIVCPTCGKATCSLPQTLLFRHLGRYSLLTLEFATQMFGDQLHPERDLRDLTTPVPENVVRAVAELEPEVGGRLEHHNRTVVVEVQDDRGDGAIVTCTCGHGPWIMDIR